MSILEADSEFKTRLDLQEARMAQVVGSAPDEPSQWQNLGPNEAAEARTRLLRQRLGSEPNFLLLDALDRIEHIPAWPPEPSDSPYWDVHSEVYGSLLNRTTLDDAKVGQTEEGVTFISLEETDEQAHQVAERRTLELRLRDLMFVHPAGQEVLKQFASVLRPTARSWSEARLLALPFTDLVKQYPNPHDFMREHVAPVEHAILTEPQETLGGHAARWQRLYPPDIWGLRQTSSEQDFNAQIAKLNETDRERVRECESALAWMDPALRAQATRQFIATVWGARGEVYVEAANPLSAQLEQVPPSEPVHIKDVDYQNIPPEQEATQAQERAKPRHVRRSLGRVAMSAIAKGITRGAGRLAKRLVPRPTPAPRTS